MNQTVYKEILWHLIRSAHDKRQSLWEAHAWVLHHNNALAHTVLSINQFHAETLQLWNTLTFTNLAPCDFLLFPKIKSVLQEIHSIKMAAMMELKKIPENTFQECFERMF